MTRIYTVRESLQMFEGMVSTMKFNNDVMEASAKNGFTNATDAADYLVRKGMPFRDAHSVIGRLVLYCIEKDKAIDDLDINEFKDICPMFDDDIYEAVSLKTCVERRLTDGAPGEQAMLTAVKRYKEYLDR